MKKLADMSIRKKLFGGILIILTANFLLLVLLGSTLFQSFYESNKVRELRRDADQLKQSYLENTLQSWEDLYSQIFTAENRNSVVSIFRLEGDSTEPDILYHSRMSTTVRLITAPFSQTEPKPKQPEAAGSDIEIRQIFVPNVDAALLAELLASPEQQTVLSPVDAADVHGKSRITLLSRLDDGLYLMMETPKEYIAATADLAVQYAAFVSIGVLFVGALGIYYLSGRFTKPIREMDAVAQKIAELDFSADCRVGSGDEIGALGASINHMSNALQSNMERLVVANQMLQDDLTRQQETDRIRRQFISDVSHDFKTPLTLMVSYAEAIREAKDPTLVTEFCDIIADEGNRLSRMVGRLLKLSRLESGMETLEKSVFSLNQLLEDTIRAQSLPLGEKRLAVVRNFCGETIVEADYQKLEQVAANLMENAVKYSPAGGKIRLSTCLLADGQCEISFWNEGAGIQDSELENIFISFYRGDKARDLRGQSYGLGLAIVNTILALHGQQCRAQNVDGGICFSFAMPVANLPED